MAIYHIQASVISRASGGSAVAAAAYRSGEKLMDERTGEQHDYSRRSGVDGSEIIAPEGAADWVRDRDRLWNAGELSEKRKDSQVAREVRVALPRELDPEQRRELVREFAKAEFTGRGMVADVSYHDGNSGNPHAHILLTTRKLNSDGFGAKDRSWNDKELLLRWREQWAERANRTLERAGSRERIDHRTLAAQRQEAIERGQVKRAAKLDRDPQIHLGKEGAALRRRGQGNERTRRNDRICAGNREREQERGRLGRAIQTVDLQIKAQQLREAVSRIGAEATAITKTVGSVVVRQLQAEAQRIREISRRRQEAAQERRDAAARQAAEQARAARQAREKAEAEAADRERRRVNFAAESHCREVEFGRLKANEKNSKGWTPLHYAAAAGRKDIAEKLIALGAHLHDRERNWSVPTPAEIAKDAGHHKMAGWLAAGAVAEKEQWSKNMMEQARAAFKERQEHQEKVITHGRAAFENSLDPELSKEQTWSERELGKEWKEQNCSWARQIERATEAARPKQEPGLERDFGPSLDL